MPSESAEADFNGQEGGADPAAAVPADVAAFMTQFVATLTTPENELEQQLAEAATRWVARHEPLGPTIPAWPAPAARCLMGSSMNNSRCSSPCWSGSGDAVPAAPTWDGGGGAGPGPGSSGRSSEEGSSAAWRLCSWLQRQGWPAQHCASFRSGSAGGSAGGSGSGWRFSSGHEFVLVYPQHCSWSSGTLGDANAGGAAPGGMPAAGGGGGGSSSSSSSDGGSSSSSGGGSSGDSDVDMMAGAGNDEDMQAALVVDPEFSTQFALSCPTPRYQVVMALLPRVFVGTYARLQQLVEWACREMQGSFQSSDGELPPWRSLDQVLAKWRLQGMEAGEGSDAGSPVGDSRVPQHPQQARQLWALDAPRMQQEQQLPHEAQRQQQRAGWQAGAGSLLGSSPASAPAACGAAFSAEQQQAMRSLLLSPTPPAVPAQRSQVSLLLAASAPLTSSSSCSSMDMLPALSGGLAAPCGAAAALPRSLLTQELTCLVKGATAPQPEHGSGPAAASLSLAYGLER